MTSLLQGKIAIVTGASSGLGRAIAVNLAAEGASVVLADVRAEPIEGGETTADVIARAGGSALFVQTDVAVWEDIDALISTTVARYGRLDVMVNNAAIYSRTGV